MSSTNGYELARTFSTFAGVDIKMLLGGEELGTMQAISYAIQREKAPLYVLGRVDPLAFSRGKRGIAGTAVALLIEQHLLFRALESSRFFVADGEELQGFASDMNSAAPNIDNIQRVDTLALETEYDVGNLSGNYQVTAAWYMDQLLPMDSVLAAVNELGIAAQMRIFGMEFLNEGSGVSIDDRTIECQHTWIARTLIPWKKTGQWGDSATRLAEGAQFQLAAE